ncbi:DUF1992 domain-containing protein [Ramlibacter sp. XY19]|uniref:DnaJ family domain-containing protein n=1 Tax=Ramlibacter paludis TaxID=2908000 RepID=UPI0023DA5EF5|nr:DnaJ family domain-containing protein [Ramlibacter paludis]MCG2592747.1 DUF1992 domain-containing protein [Ramlibacter paludis]
MGTLDDEIRRHLEAAAASGELRAAPSYGKPLARPEGWDETPEEFKQSFKILKDAGFAPPEVALFHERARLRGLVGEAMTAAEKNALLQQLSALEQKIALRLEAMRTSASL